MPANMPFRSILRAAAAAALAMTPIAASAAPAPQEDAVAEIRAIEEAMETMYNSDAFAKDASVGLPYFAPGAEITLFDIMKPGVFKGEAFRKHYLGIGQDFVGKVEFLDYKIEASGDMAYVAYTQHYVGRDSKGNPFDMQLLTTDIFRRIGGKWLIVHEQVTLPIDRATLQQVMAPAPKP